MAVREDFPRILAELIEKTGVSKSKVAEAAGVGSSSVTHWLSGRNLPALDRLDPIAELFKIDPIVLIGGADDSTKIGKRDLDTILRELASMRGFNLVPKGD